MSGARPWAETDVLAEFKQNQIDQQRYEIKNAVKCQKITECATYDEFKEHVAAAFLKPVDLRRRPKSEETSAVGGKSTVHDVNIQKWTEKEENDGLCSKLASDLRSTRLSELSCPKTVHDFTRVWSDLKTVDERIKYLRLIPSGAFPKIFSVEGSVTNVFGPILAALAAARAKAVKDDGKKAADKLDGLLLEVLNGLSRTPGVGLTVGFLEDGELRVCHDLVGALRAASDGKGGLCTAKDVDGIVERLELEV